MESRIILNVKDNGAVGDGVNDDTTAIQTLIDGAPSGSIIYFPAGDYLVTHTIFLKEQIKYLGGNWLSRIVRAYDFPTGEPILYLKAQSGGYNQNFWIENLEIDGNKKDSLVSLGEDGVLFEGVETAFFDNIHVISCAGSGINTTSPILNNTIHFRNSFIRENNQHGIFIHQFTSDCHILQCDIGNNGLANVNLAGTSSTIRQSTIWGSKTDVGILCIGDSNHIEGCQIEGNARHAIHLYDCSHCSVLSSKIYASILAGSIGIYLSTSQKLVKNILIGNNMIYSSIVEGYSEFSKAIFLNENHLNIKVLGNNVSYLGIGTEQKDKRPYVEGLKLSKGDQWTNIDDVHYVLANLEEAVVVYANTYTKIPLSHVQEDLSDLVSSNGEIHIREDKIYTVSGMLMLSAIDQESSYRLRAVVKNTGKTYTLQFFNPGTITTTVPFSSQILFEANDVIYLDFVSTMSTTTIQVNTQITFS